MIKWASGYGLTRVFNFTVKQKFINNIQNARGLAQAWTPGHTKLWNIINFVMLFQAVMKFLSRSKF